MLEENLTSNVKIFRCISEKCLSGSSAERLSNRDKREWESGSLSSELGFCLVSRTTAATVRENPR